jgi:DNA-entry nuclease
LNYKDGTSRVKNSGTTVVAKAKKTAKKKTTRVIRHVAHRVSTARYRVIGNKRSKIYHVASGQNYHMSSANAVYFKSEAAARAAGYRKSKR